MALCSCFRPQTTEVVTTTEYVPPTTEPKPQEKFTVENWDLLASDPDAHKGAAVDIVGHVFTAPERNDQGVGIQMCRSAPRASSIKELAKSFPLAAILDEENLAESLRVVEWAFGELRAAAAPAGVAGPIDRENAMASEVETRRTGSEEGN